MNRRDAIAALVSLPEVARIATLTSTPSMVIVVECDGCISLEVADRLKKTLASVWPDNKIVVMDSGLRLKVVEQS